MWHRKPVVAGAFYPAEPSHLRAMVGKYLDMADRRPLSGKAVGLVSPHAGYIYSGPIAAFSFRQMDPETEVLVVLAPSHRARFRGASVFPEGIFETPLGEVEVDSKIGRQLLEKPLFSFLKEAHQFEHSLEVQVPFAQVVLGPFTIVPIIVGVTDMAACAEIASGLADVLKQETRKYSIVLSTDLSHYYSYGDAVSMDGRLIKALETFDPAVLEKTISAGSAEACGEGPLLAGMSLCRELGAKKMEILKYANSGDTAGDKSQVVGYLAAAMVK